MEPTYISKMSVKALGCKPNAVTAKEDGDNTALPLCKIIGKAEGLKHGEDKSGNVWTAISGQFEGVNLATNEVFRSGKLFLPGGIQETIEAPLANAEKENKAVVIQFGLEISAVKASNPIGYSYQAKSLVPVQEADELAELRKLMVGAPAPVKQIEAPAPAPAPKAEAPKAVPAKGGKR